MARLEALTVAEMDRAVQAWRSDLAADRDRDPAELRTQLRELHDLLIRLTPDGEEPRNALVLVAETVAGIDEDVVDRLQSRPRVVMRLLQAGQPAVAWQVLGDNAVNRAPLRVRVEAPAVFAQLPGFRDPRYDAPDSCYDVTDRTRLRARLDEIEIDPDGGLVRLAGWAAVDLLGTSPEGNLRLLLSDQDRQLAIETDRVRRSDRRGWAGWTASIDVRAGTGIETGRWALSVETEEQGLLLTAALGADASELAQATALGTVEIGDRTVRWGTRGNRWKLIVR